MPPSKVRPVVEFPQLRLHSLRYSPPRAVPKSFGIRLPGVPISHWDDRKVSEEEDF